MQSNGTAEKAVVDQFPIPAALVEHLLLGPVGDRRVLQDSPILGDVWLAYALDPASIQDLLITPHWETTAAAVANAVSSRLSVRTERPERKGARIAYLQGIVAARLHFDEVLRILVPLTQWWDRGDILAKLKDDDPEKIRSRMHRLLSPENFRAHPERISGSPGQDNFSTLDRYIALAGLILWVGEQNPAEAEKELQPIDIEDVFKRYGPNIDGIVDALLTLFKAISDESAETSTDSRGERRDEAADEPRGALVFQVSLNRHASTALDRSVPAVKADAARTLFSVDCKRIVWAVLDAGIFGKHDAFMSSEQNPAERKSRVRKTFDFTNIREIVSSDNEDIDDMELEKLLIGVDLGTTSRADRLNKAREHLKSIAGDARNRRPVDWGTVEKLITRGDAPPPSSPHGTHVAGIIGADRLGNGKTSKYAYGMCPDIGLYDFRVLAKSLEDTEFSVIAALQYIRYVNERHSYITIHGANLSLSIPHNVRNFACGRTPVCNECERLVESGVVVVAAAGNRGYQNFETKEGNYEGYAAFSITDPGNSDGVVTVGATHGNWPHTYGVSFFSSRGPTGDGRLKPDLVAPGERVQSTVLGNEWGPESGTSMAAPHVSGAAAMLLARYPELVGQPRRVKRILCESATDLGRERSFQGHGMLDVLRAFQSI